MVFISDARAHAVRTPNDTTNYFLKIRLVLTFCIEILLSVLFWYLFMKMTVEKFHFAKPFYERAPGFFVCIKF